jgi:hypothetical protein
MYMKRLTRFLAVLACLALLPAAASAESNSSRLNKERLEVGRALIEVTFDNVGSIIPYYSDDIEYHDPIVDVYGIGEMTAFLFTLFGSSPDLVTTVEDEIAVNDMYTAAWTMVGTFAGVPYEAKGMSIVKFRDKSALVYYQRDYYTEGDIMINIDGLDQVVCGFRGFYRAAVNPGQDPDPECLP